jgi:hypothetical protein
MKQRKRRVKNKEKRREEIRMKQMQAGIPTPIHLNSLATLCCRMTTPQRHFLSPSHGATSSLIIAVFHDCTTLFVTIASSLFVQTGYFKVQLVYQQNRLYIMKLLDDYKRSCIIRSVYTALNYGMILDNRVINTTDYTALSTGLL